MKINTVVRVACNYSQFGMRTVEPVTSVAFSCIGTISYPVFPEVDDKIKAIDLCKHLGDSAHALTIEGDQPPTLEVLDRWFALRSDTVMVPQLKCKLELYFNKDLVYSTDGMENHNARIHSSTYVFQALEKLGFKFVEWL